MSATPCCVRGCGWEAATTCGGLVHTKCSRPVCLHHASRESDDLILCPACATEVDPPEWLLDQRRAEGLAWVDGLRAGGEAPR